jgi:hypothetical protein
LKFLEGSPAAMQRNDEPVPPEQPSVLFDGELRDS